MRGAGWQLRGTILACRDRELTLRLAKQLLLGDGAIPFSQKTQPALYSIDAPRYRAKPTYSRPGAVSDEESLLKLPKLPFKDHFSCFCLDPEKRIVDLELHTTPGISSHCQATILCVDWLARKSLLSVRFTFRIGLATCTQAFSAL